MLYDTLYSLQLSLSFSLSLTLSLFVSRPLSLAPTYSAIPHPQLQPRKQKHRPPLLQDALTQPLTTARCSGKRKLSHSSTSARPEKRRRTNSLTVSIERKLVDTLPQKTPVSSGALLNRSHPIPSAARPSALTGDGLTVKLSRSMLQKGASPGTKRHRSKGKGRRSLVERAEYGGILVGGELPDSGYMMSADQVVPSDDSFGSKLFLLLVN